MPSWNLKPIESGQENAVRNCTEINFLSLADLVAESKNGDCVKHAKSKSVKCRIAVGDSSAKMIA